MSKVKEILCLHHSHLDIGYTHPQPLLLELQRDYIDEAIDLCLKTEDYPEESRFRWTCEATYPVLKWLETASEERVGAFQRMITNGQIGIAAMMMHTTPLVNAEQVARILAPIRELRQKFDIKINTAINHDVNGQPWPISQLLLDAGVDFYITGINVHFGGIPFKRPAVFNWLTPDQRSLLTFQGEHYSLFSQFFHTSMADTNRMHEGIKEYVDRLESNGYEHDFIYLTATNPPLFDNNCPDPQLADLIRQYNEEGHEFKVRFVTPEMLLEKVKGIDPKTIPTYSGDWTDFWNFGSGSSAREVRLNRRTKHVLRKSELLEALQGSPGKHYDNIKAESYLQVNLFDEHTWGAAHSITDPDHPEVYSQRNHKSHMAYQGADLSAYLLGKQMEKLAANPLQSWEPEGILVVNTSDVSQTVPLNVPKEFFIEGRHLAAARVKQFLPYGKDEGATKYFGTIELAPYSYKKIPFRQLEEQLTSVQKEQVHFSVTENTIETPFYLMTFDPKSGRIVQLHDKKRHWDMLDKNSEWTLFEYINESISPLHHTQERSTFFPRDVDLGNKSISVWNHHWKSIRTGAKRVTSYEIDTTRHDSVSYIMHVEAPGVSRMEQKITFHVNDGKIELIASLDKADIRTPESIYFAFPLQLQQGWKSQFDTAGMFVELDREQLGTVSKDWVTVDQTVSIYDEQKGVTLACPDAPLVQIGDFNFGKESKEIERNENPLLLAWPMNNYWDTNFWINQPGRIQFKYELTPFAQFDQVEAHKAGVSATDPVEINMAISCASEESGQLLAGEGEGIVPLYIKPAADNNGFILTLRNLTEKQGTYTFSVPGKTIISSSNVSILEEDLSEIEIINGAINITLLGRQHQYVRVVLGE
ncbi:hypothetical protein RCG19_07490 [Neobacillus sp. OS1-2]|uniref:glycoside hydrolase family 38 N-terminal domain-containing protein n=1 Tax=Neobacillus sp. OS1-2 TaxID=3070680 RepID=UPI0027E1AD03|nr:hypothetical protein [Neobacillus sp. OS1-2]WML41484.1 hypothetical protein RCG19_07490 [Neobacillus sp. OS1-2]